MPEEVRKKIDELDSKDFKEYQLRVIKSTRKEPQTGDVFVLTPKEMCIFMVKY